jgi:threonine/homoserine/homoserine lactone efflux protein
MLISLLVGIVTGFALAIPPGPINFAVFEKSIHGQRRAALRLILGAVTGDTFYCLIAIIYQLSSELLTLVKEIFSGFGGLFLAGLGLYYLLHSRKHSAAAPADPDDAHQGHYFTGLLVALSNPFLVVVMLAITELYYSIGVLYLHMGANLLFILGFQVGTFLWLRGIGTVVSLNRHRFADFTGGIQRLCGLAYLGFGLYLLGKFVKLVFL